MLFETFRQFRKERPDDPAFLVSLGDRSLPITWKKFTNDIAAVVWIIRRHSPGGMIALLGENSYEWIVTHAACLFSGATAVSIDANLNADDIARRLRVVSAGVLLHSSLYADKAHDVASRMPGLATGGFGTRKTDFYISAAIKGLELLRKTVWDGPAPDGGKTSAIIFTSGTTSEPRGVEITIRGIETFVESTSKALRMGRGDSSLMLLPLHHIFGLAAVYAMLSNGVAVGVCPDFRRIFDAMVRFRADFVFVVPAFADILAAKIERVGKSADEVLGQPVRWLVTGGAPLSRRTYERLTALGIPTLSAYGLTETSACFSMGRESFDPRPCSAGQVAQVEGVETRVSETGELLVRGPCVMNGYFNAPAATAKAIDSEGWFHTGDTGRIDSDGTVWITGRMSRTIVLSSGKKIAPEELEGRLMSLPGILEALVSGEGETRDVRAEVYASVPEQRAREIVAALNRTLPVYQRIKTLTVRRDPFPRTSSGKIKLS